MSIGNTPEKGSYDEALKPLPIPVPPMLENVLGYNGQARFFCFYWLPYGSKPYIYDGRRGVTGDADGYLAFIEHPVIAGWTLEYDLGAGDTDTIHALMLDREERIISAGARDYIEKLLLKQWTKKLRPEEGIREEVIKELLSALDLSTWREVTPPSQEDILKAYHERIRRIEEMKNWLNSHKAS